MSLGPDARSLLAAADGGDDPSSSDEARIRAKLATRLAIAAGTGIAATTAAKTATASAGTAVTTSLAAKIAIGVAFVSVTTAGGTMIYERTTHDPAPTVVEAPPAAVRASSSPSSSPSPSPSPSPSSSPSPPAPADPLLPPPPTIAITPPKPIALAKPTPTAKPVALPPPPIVASDTIAEEAALLRAAHASLASGDGSSAMSSLDEHARRFPRGALAEEREAARVLALCAQGRASEARASASAFVASNPRSTFAAQVRRSCANKSSE